MPKDDTTTEKELRKVLAEVLASQSLAVLATYGDAQPYCSLVGFAALPDLKSLVFATMRATRKFGNLKANPQVAMMIDTRTNSDVDFQQAVAITAIGEVQEVPKTTRSRYLRCYLDKHAELAAFILSPDCALVRIRVRKYVIVRRFREVLELTV